MNKPYKKIFEKRWVDVKLEEEIRLSDLYRDAASPFTLKWRSVRNKIKGTENKLSKIVDVKINKNDDYITWIFLTEPTYSFDNKVTPEPPSLNFKTDNLYTIKFRFFDFFKYAQTNPDFVDSKQITIDEMKELLQTISVKVNCDCPSFYAQGLSYQLTQLDGSLYPNNIEPKRWNAPALHNGEGYVCKHIYGVARQYKFFLNHVVSILNKKLKSL